ncbi:hypothetical protein GA829_22255 [Mesorhizobium sp. INR15]|nr:hypothetical protein GA829_22255 [Mesorhizobium sp. INR15]
MQSVFIRGVVVAWSGLSTLLALHWLIELGMLGFPDGYITPFARATSPLLHGLAIACLAQGLYFFVRGLIASRSGMRALCLQIVAAAIVTVAPVLVIESCPNSRTCSSIYETLTGTMMDDGTGG